jgi:acetyltransferase-like isoleucine patch superfamily enzyme
MKIKYAIMGKVASLIQKYRIFKLKILGYSNINPKAIIESKINLDRVYPQGLHIGENTLVASRSTLLCHEHVKRDGSSPENPWVTDTYIGRNCFIGIGAIILPGVRIGDEVIIGAGSVVTKNIPSNSIAVGNPARVIRNGIKMNNKAILENN